MKDNIDFFSHEIVAKKMSTIFSGQSFAGSFVIAINGAWGTGKTHLMTNVLSKLDDTVYIKVNFNAWRYAVKEDVRRALLICIIDECRKYVENDDNKKYLGWKDTDLKIIKQLFDDTERALYTAFVKETPGEVSINTGNLLKSGMNMVLKFIPWGNFGNEFVQKIFSKKGSDASAGEVNMEKEDIEELWGIFSRSTIKRNIEKVISIEQFRKAFEIMLKAVLSGKYEGDAKREKLNEHNKEVKLIVVIDDLDRCLPEDALDVLEAIKLFIDFPNTYFMIAMDGNIIQKGLNVRYNQYDSSVIRAKDYYEKMIDLSFNMPAAIKEKIFTYIQSLSQNGEDYIKMFDVLFIALNTNLRAWQRFVHRADLNKAIIEEIAGQDIFKNKDMRQAYIKVQCLSYQWPELYRAIYDIDTYLHLEWTVKQIINYNEKEIDKILLEMGKFSVREDIQHALFEKRMTDFILAEPKLSRIYNKNMSIFFTYDRI